MDCVPITFDESLEKKSSYTSEGKEDVGKLNIL